MKKQITIKGIGLLAILFLLALVYNTVLACCPCETNINTLQDPGVESDFAGDPINLVSSKVLLFVAVDSEDNYIYFEYDSLGRKVVRADNNGYFCYIYDGMNLVADYDVNNGRITRTYTYGPGVDNIQSMTTYDQNGNPAETYYYIKDASNTVHFLIDANGSVIESYHYDAFGNFKIRDKDYDLITESACGNRFLFQGREYDYDTALYYFRARWYEPETGRWLSPDPIGISGGLNLYAFCGNDPVNFVDPDGDIPVPILFGGIIGGIVGGISAGFANDWDLTSIAIGVAGGAISGAISGAVSMISVGNFLTTGLISGGIGAGVSNAIDQGLDIADNNQCEFNWWQLGIQASYGAIEGCFGGGLANSFPGALYKNGIPVSSWAKGVTPDFTPGRWCIIGSAKYDTFTYTLLGFPHQKDQFNVSSQIIDSSRLVSPGGWWGWLHNALGHRRIVK